MSNSSNWFAIEKEETERLTGHISEEYGRELERVADEHGEKSFVVAEALNMYLRRGDFARLENKLDLALAAERVPHRGRHPETSVNKNEDYPHGLGEDERHRVEGVIGQSEAQGSEVVYKNGASYRLDVMIPVSLREAVYEELDGQRGVGEEVLNPALAMYFQYGGWMTRVEQKLDLLLGHHDVPQPQPTAWTVQVKDDSPHVDAGPYRATATVDASVDYGAIKPEMALQIDADSLEPSKIKKTTKAWAGAVCAMVRYDIAEYGLFVRKDDVMGKYVDMLPIESEKSERKVYRMVVEQLIDEGYTPDVTTEFVLQSDSHDHSEFPDKFGQGIGPKDAETDAEAYSEIRKKAKKLIKKKRSEGAHRRKPVPYARLNEWIKREKG